MKKSFQYHSGFFSINRFNPIFIHHTIQNIHSDFGIIRWGFLSHKNHLAGISCAVLCNITIIHCFSTQNSFRFKLEKKSTENQCLGFSLSYLKCNASLEFSLKLKKGNIHRLAEVGRLSFPCCVCCTMQAIFWCKWYHSLRHPLPRAGIVGQSRSRLSWDRGPLGVSNPILQWLTALSDQVPVPFCDYFTLLYRMEGVILISSLGMQNTAELYA